MRLSKNRFNFSPNITWFFWKYELQEKVLAKEHVFFVPMPTSQAVQIYKASGLKHVINVSQQIDRMRVKKPGIIPCITPKGLFYDLSRDRLLVPTEKFMVMGFPVDRMDLSTLSARDSLPKR